MLFPSATRQAGAGGLYALHGPSEEKWTEEYQSAPQGIYGAR